MHQDARRQQASRPVSSTWSDAAMLQSNTRYAWRLAVRVVAAARSDGLSHKAIVLDGAPSTGAGVVRHGDRGVHSVPLLSVGIIRHAVAHRRMCGIARDYAITGIEPMPPPGRDTLWEMQIGRQ